MKKVVGCFFLLSSRFFEVIKVVKSGGVLKKTLIMAGLYAESFVNLHLVSGIFILSFFHLYRVSEIHETDD